MRVNDHGVSDPVRVIFHKGRAGRRRWSAVVAATQAAGAAENRNQVKGSKRNQSLTKHKFEDFVESRKQIAEISRQNGGRPRKNSTAHVLVVGTPENPSDTTYSYRFHF